ncbi:hypothetical protein [Clostridium beijerinckii]|uniref:hypothetical protein n=1 Tax=Clostridium beijerinckii TaxID=1520 RepID=UPI00156E5F1D|nr:hypothetical protein [Clostridium beijerinckii]MBA8937266.1 hypothetical protein [Clostridium beijerinckii]NRU40268.1 hypothetical protein [Clostridium beijerinckii]NSA96455.1 hypothetical protein [Clostridium beijerinckii]
MIKKILGIFSIVLITCFLISCGAPKLLDKTEEANSYEMQNGKWNSKYTYVKDCNVKFITSNYRYDNDMYADKLTMYVEENNNLGKGYFVKIIDSNDNIKSKLGESIKTGDEIKISKAEVEPNSLNKYPDNVLLLATESNIELLKEKESSVSTDTHNDNTSLNYTLEFGTLVDATVNNNALIIKAKIKPSVSNKTTIDQNGFNVEDLIVNQGASKFNEIQYWAVADMTDGSESKVVSFKVNKDLINKINNKNMFGNQIIDYAGDVWILPSLKN